MRFAPAAWLFSCFLLLPGPPARAQEAGPKAELRKALRDRVRDLERTIEVIRMAGMGGGVPSDAPGLTDQVNALLASPRADLAAVLGEILAPGDEEDRGERGIAPVAAFLLGIPPVAGKQFNGEQLVEMQGFSLVAWIGMTGWGSPGPSPPPTPEVKVLPDATFRPPLRPRPFDLLKEILGGSETVRFYEEGIESTFRSSAGLELGEAARKDPEFAKFLRAGAAEEPRDPCAAAVVRTAVRRLESAGASPRDEDARRDAEARPLLEAVRKDPSPPNLGALANLLNDAMAAKESVGLRMEAFEEARKAREAAEDPQVRGWAFALMQTSLWPGLYWRFGYMQGKNFPEDADREAPLPDGSRPEQERDYFLGAWPDPDAQGAALKADLAAGLVKPARKWGGLAGRDPGRKGIDIWADRAPEKDRRIDLEGRYEPGRVVLKVTNRRDGPIAMNSVAARYAVAMMVPLKGEPEGRVELDLQPGRVLQGYRLLVPASALKVILPGESHEVAFACGALRSGSRILISYRDEFEVDGDSDVPVLSDIRGLLIQVR